LSPDRARAADLVVTMAVEHREALEHDLEVASRTFTLKELVRLLETLPPAPSDAGGLADRVAAASQARREGFQGNPLDEDVADPIGLPLQSYRAIAWELDEWVARLVDGLYGAEQVPTANEA
jgi:protein-tyrosine-phosphatase